MALILHSQGRRHRVVATLQGLPTCISRHNSSSSSRTEEASNRKIILHGAHIWSKPAPACSRIDRHSTPSSLQRFQVAFKSTATNSTTLVPSKRQADDEVVEKKPPLPSPSLLLDFGIPSLIPEWRKMFNKDTLFTDLSAGLTVGCIAVPLSLAIAVASGVPAEVGLVTAAVSGVAGGLMGGTSLAITGPAAAISLLVLSAVQQHGLEALPFITLACGGLQLASGVTRLGVVAKLVPVSVIAGFTTGVGTLILSGQVPKALGMENTPTGMNPMEVAGYIGENLSAIHPAAAALALGTSAAMYLLPKLHSKIPAALLAVGGATFATSTFDLDVSLVGAIPSGLEAFQFAMPIMPALDSLPSLCATVGLIYTMTSVESLLSCAALEKMKKTGYKHDPDQELVGQGLANVASAMFMGMPVTSVIARSGLNLRLGAETRLPALVQSGFVFSGVVFFSDKISMIPMPALSGMLITTGMSMLNPTEFKHCYAVQKIDAIPFAATVAGMIAFGLAEGIGVGCATAVALNYRDWSQSVNATSPRGCDRNQPSLSRMQAQEASGIYHGRQPNNNVSYPGISTDTISAMASDANTPFYDQSHPEMQVEYTSTVHQDGEKWNFYDADGQELTLNPATSSLWSIRGPINFLSMFAIDDMIRTIKGRTFADSSVDAILLDMADVTAVEFTGIEELVNRLMEVSDHGKIPVRLVNVNDTLHNALDQCDPMRQISRFSALYVLSSQ